MKYLSLFSGIGGFEVALRKIYPVSECIAFSEVKPHAIKVYQSHFPNHKNLGDITKIKTETIKKLVRENGCDLVVGGFPCKNLSSLATIKGGNTGLEGKKSKLFYDMLRVIQTINSVLDKKVYVIFENNASMSNKNKSIITDLIKMEYPNIYTTTLNSSSFGVQCRNRIFWTNFFISKTDIKCLQYWKDVLDPVDTIPNISENYVNCLNKSLSAKRTSKKFIQVKKNRNKKYYFSVIKFDNCKSRWQMSFHSDNANTEEDIPYSYPVGKSRPITASFGNHNVLVDRRKCKKGEFTIRMFSFTEIEKLFGYETGYTKLVAHSKNKRREVLGNSVVVLVIEHILKNLKITQKTPVTV